MYAVQYNHSTMEKEPLAKKSLKTQNHHDIYANDEFNYYIWREHTKQPFM